MSAAKKKIITVVSIIIALIVLIFSTLTIIGNVKCNEVRSQLSGKAFKGTCIYTREYTEYKKTYKIKFTGDEKCYVYRCELVDGKCYDKQHDYYEIPYTLTGGIPNVKLDILGEYGTDIYCPLSGEKPFTVKTDGDKIVLEILGYIPGYATLILEEYDDSSEPVKVPTKIN